MKDGIGEGLKVYLAGPPNPQVMILFKNLGFQGTNDLMDAHLCVFTGGADINTELYGEEPISECGWFNEKRDEYEVQVYQNCREFDIPMVGICRGAQFLNVMNGGTLWQHVTGHRESHQAVDLILGHVITVTSTHHQMMRPAETAEVLMVTARDGKPAALSPVKKAHNVTHTSAPQEAEPEVLWYEDTRCLCVQFHPENHDATKECRKYFEELLNDFVIPETQVILVTEGNED